LIELGYKQGGVSGYGLRRLLIDSEHKPKSILVRGQRKNLQSDRVILIPGPEEEQRIVHEIYRSFVEEAKSERCIVADLNARGISSGTGRPWTYGLVHEILNNPKYIGANVFNRTSEKLRMGPIRNPEALWVRRDGAFTPIVSEEMFRKARMIVESRKRKRTDNEMLEELQSLLKKAGRLSYHLIDQSRETAASGSYSKRFGSLRHAYKRIGYTQDRDLSYCDARRNRKVLRTECLNQISSNLLAARASVLVDHQNGVLRINKGFSVRLIVVKCSRNEYNRPRWRVQPGSSLNCDLTIVARMDEENIRIRDYFLFPKSVRLRNEIVLSAKNSPLRDLYRFDTLEQFYRICRTKNVGEI